MDLALSGLASGFDWKTVVEQLADVERAPQRRLRSEQTRINQKKDAVSGIVTELDSLKTKAEALNEASLYNKRSVTSSDEDVATATATSSAAKATYSFNITTLAKAAIRTGGSNAGGDVDINAAVTSSSAGFGISVTTGTFTVNGTSITVDNSKNLSAIMQEIRDAIGGAATVNYNNDKIEIDGAGTTVVLGSAADTSNFLSATRLFGNGTDSVTSNGEIGGIRLSGTLTSELTGLTAGTFTINGVQFTITGSETVSSILETISNSAAEVTASYDAVNDRFLLTNKKTGNIGFSLSDGTSDFLAKTKLLTSAGGSLSAGTDAEFTVTGFGTFKSNSNTLTENSHGIQGLSVSALTTGATTITVDKDTAELKTAIKGLVDQYNKVQTLIDNNTASSTDSEGKVTAGILATDTTVTEVASRLREQLLSDGPSSLDIIKRLESLGYKSSGFSNKLTLEDESALDDALDDDLDEVKTFFTDSSDGVAKRTETYVENLVDDDDGILVNHRDSFLKQSKRIDEQIIELEKIVQANKQRLTASFISMEKAQSQINQQMQFLASRFR